MTPRPGTSSARWKEGTPRAKSLADSARAASSEATELTCATNEAAKTKDPPKKIKRSGIKTRNNLFMEKTGGGCKAGLDKKLPYPVPEPGKNPDPVKL
jgi:hypothetical protein